MVERHEITTHADQNPQYVPALPAGVCRFCACTNERACDPPCFWIDEDQTVCSAPACVDRHFGCMAGQVKRLMRLARAGAV